MNQEFGICNLAVVPLRTAPSDKEEMCSQLLFGDHFQILELNEKWTRIQTAYDEYEGWIDNKQYTFIDQATFVQMHDLNFVLGITQAVFKATEQDSLEQHNLVAGSNIPDCTNGSFRLNEIHYLLDDAAYLSNQTFRVSIADTAMYYLNSPYLWGGKTLFGIDCSGFTQMVMRQFGIRIKRDAWQQAEQGELVAFLQEAIAGDLAFFDNEEGRIVHVGIMLDTNKIIHASGKVRIDRIDNQGIYHNELNRYTHKLRIIRRMAKIT